MFDVAPICPGVRSIPRSLVTCQYRAPGAALIGRSAAEAAGIFRRVANPPVGRDATRRVDFSKIFSRAGEKQAPCCPVDSRRPRNMSFAVQSIVHRRRDGTGRSTFDGT